MYHLTSSQGEGEAKLLFDINSLDDRRNISEASLLFKFLRHETLAIRNVPRKPLTML